MTDCVSCLVCLPGLFGNQSLWIDPVPIQDEGRALIGKRIRCCYPKQVLSCIGVRSRFVEGHVVGCLELPSDRTSHVPFGRSFAVQLLVDKAALDSCPFLESLDAPVHVWQA